MLLLIKCQVILRQYMFLAYISDYIPFFSIFQDKPAQLIFYDRPDVEGPKLSDYHITMVVNPDDLKVNLIEINIIMPSFSTQHLLAYTIELERDTFTFF